MEPSKAVKEYKEELIKSQKQNERLTTLVGKVIPNSKNNNNAVYILIMNIKIFC
jgi:hypothetical protein